MYVHETGKQENKDALDKSCMAPRVLTLKIGCQVLLLQNLDTLAGLVNGTSGIVQDVEWRKTWNAPNSGARAKIGPGGSKASPVMRISTMRPDSNMSTGKKENVSVSLDVVKHSVRVLVDFGKRGYKWLEPHKWSISVGKQVKASRQQIPCMVAYACTIHKAQGMTLENAVIDLGGTFAAGQAYVALSRLQSTAGLYILDNNRGDFGNHIHEMVMADSRAVDFYQNLKPAGDLPSVMFSQPSMASPSMSPSMDVSMSPARTGSVYSPTSGTYASHSPMGQMASPPKYEAVNLLEGVALDDDLTEELGRPQTEVLASQAEIDEETQLMREFDEDVRMVPSVEKERERERGREKPTANTDPEVIDIEADIPGPHQAPPMYIPLLPQENKAPPLSQYGGPAHNPVVKRLPVANPMARQDTNPMGNRVANPVGTMYGGVPARSAAIGNPIPLGQVPGANPLGQAQGVTEYTSSPESQKNMYMPPHQGQRVLPPVPFFGQQPNGSGGLVNQPQTIGTVRGSVYGTSTGPVQPQHSGGFDIP
ncbi:DNA helicase, partial [Kipferlia bialata]|eukprot:g7899.t1